MRQRLSLAKTLLHDPELLILDEPASGLDARARIEIRSLLKELGRMGKTVIVSSHILADLEEICSVVAIMEVGQVLWTGSLQEVRQQRRTEHFNVVLEVAPQDLKRAVKLLQTLDVIEAAKVVEEKLEASGEIGDAEAYGVAYLAGNAEVREKVSGDPFRREMIVKAGKKHPGSFPLPDELRTDVAVQMDRRPSVFLVTLAPRGRFSLRVRRPGLRTRRQAHSDPREHRDLAGAGARDS
jgi:ABC-type multidrug transport system ATPase subunit